MMRKRWCVLGLLLPCLAQAYITNNPNDTNGTTNSLTTNQNGLSQMIAQKTSDALKTFNKVTYKGMSGNGKEDFFNSQNDDSADGDGQTTFKIKNSGQGD